MKKPLVSVVVPTRNSAQFLERCLASIRNQSYANVEVIAVDNYSSDGTAEIARKYADKFYQKGPERSSQRNYGAKMSKGRYLLFIDSDMELSRNVVVSSDGIGGVIIPEISVGEGFWAKCKALEKECYIGDETIEAARFFERKVFLSINGYDIKMVSAEDWDLHNRIKKKVKIGRINSFIKHHELNLSLWLTINKKYYYGKFLNLYLSKYPENTKKQFSLIKPAFLRNWKKLIKNPVHCIGMIFMKFCEFGAGGIGFLVSKVRK